MGDIQYTIYNQSNLTKLNLRHIRRMTENIVGGDFLEDKWNITTSGPISNLSQAIQRDNTFLLLPNFGVDYPFISQFTENRIGDVVDEVLIDFGRCVLYYCQVVTEWKEYDGVGVFVLDKNTMIFYFYCFLRHNSNQSIINYIWKSM